MPTAELQQFFLDLYTDLYKPRILWQVLIIGVAIAAGALASRLSRSYLKTRDTRWQRSFSGAYWLAFPATALSAALIGRAILLHWQKAHLLDIAIALLWAMIIIGAVVRVPIAVQISYRSDLDAALRVLVDTAAAHPRVLKEPAPKVLITAFADNGIDLELGVWVKDPEEGRANLRSDIYYAVWREFRAQGIEIPYPQREVRLLGNGDTAAQQR